MMSTAWSPGTSSNSSLTDSTRLLNSHPSAREREGLSQRVQTRPSTVPQDPAQLLCLFHANTGRD